MKDKRKYVDRAEYLKIAVVKRRKIVRQKAIEYKGGKCQLCGYNNNFYCHREVENGITQLPREIEVETSRDNGEG